MTFTLLRTARSLSRTLCSALALTVALTAGASLVGVTPVQAARRDDKDEATYIIKRIYKAKDTDKYRIYVKMNMDIPGSPVDMVETMLMTETTREATDDGAFDVASVFESASVTVNGMKTDITGMMPKFIMTRDKNGKTDIKLEGGNEAFTGQAGDQVKQITDASSKFLPKKPVKVGDSWDLDAADFGAAGQTVKGKSTLVSVETVKGKKVGKIKSTMDITGQMGLQMHSDTTVLMDMATGKALSVISKSEGDVGGGKMTMEMALRLLGPEDKVDAKEAVKTDAVTKP
jgi:hypothetical protein